MVRPCASNTFDTTPEGSVAATELLNAIAAIATLGINLLNCMMRPPRFAGGIAPVGARNMQQMSSGWVLDLSNAFVVSLLIHIPDQ
jgi:hypothetical protein